MFTKNRSNRVQFLGCTTSPGSRIVHPAHRRHLLEERTWFVLPDLCHEVRVHAVLRLRARVQSPKCSRSAAGRQPFLLAVVSSNLRQNLLLPTEDDRLQDALLSAELDAICRTGTAGDQRAGCAGCGEAVWGSGAAPDLSSFSPCRQDGSS